MQPAMRSLRQVADILRARSACRAKVTMSFRVAACVAGLSVHAVINEADMRLYSAKNTGRNRVVA
jgi:PleD family two-component response regulator